MKRASKKRIVEDIKACSRLKTELHTFVRGFIWSLNAGMAGVIIKTNTKEEGYEAK